MSCGIGRRHGSDPTLLWLWHRLGGYSSDSTPSLGTSVCCQSGPRNGKKDKKKKKEICKLIKVIKVIRNVWGSRRLVFPVPISYFFNQLDFIWSCSGWGKSLLLFLCDFFSFLFLPWALHFELLFSGHNLVLILVFVQRPS